MCTTRHCLGDVAAQTQSSRRAAVRVKTPGRPKTEAKWSFLCLIRSQEELSGGAFSGVPLGSFTTWGRVYITFANSWRLCDSDTSYSVSWFVYLLPEFQRLSLNSKTSPMVSKCIIGAGWLVLLVLRDVGSIDCKYKVL